MAKKQPVDTDPALDNFEAAVDELEAIIERIESGEIGLEESIAQYERGVSLHTSCKAILSRAQQRIKELTTSNDEPS